MSEYIKKEDVLKVIENGYCFVPEATWAIRNIPSIDIVRCDECRLYETCEYLELGDDDFCSRGERSNEQMD